MTSTHPPSQKPANDDQLRTVCGPIQAVGGASGGWARLHFGSVHATAKIPGAELLTIADVRDGLPDGPKSKGGRPIRLSAWAIGRGEFGSPGKHCFQVRLGPHDYGRDGKPSFWIAEAPAGAGMGPNRENHVAIQAANENAVRAFHQAAVERGAESLHEPRPWPEYHPGYFGAFVRDPDGNNVEAVWHGGPYKALVSLVCRTLTPPTLPLCKSCYATRLPD